MTAPDAGDYSVLTFGAISGCSTQSDAAAVTVGGCVACASPGDSDADGDMDLVDMQRFTLCFGPGNAVLLGCECTNLDDSNTDIDLADWSILEDLITGP